MIKIIPVIHYNNTKQLISNITTCGKFGLDSVFLIDHAMDNDNLLENARDMKLQFPKMWIGVNLLGVKTIDALQMNLKIDGLWSDQSLTLEEYSDRTFGGLYFGGLAFKYQPQPIDLEEACKNAILTTDVATTSGPGTGKSATFYKLKTIRVHLGEHPMAIASGVDYTNIKQYDDLGIDYALVASSIIDYTNGEEIISDFKLDRLLNSLK